MFKHKSDTEVVAQQVKRENKKRFIKAEFYHGNGLDYSMIEYDIQEGRMLTIRGSRGEGYDAFLDEEVTLSEFVGQVAEYRAYCEDVKVSQSEKNTLAWR